MCSFNYRDFYQKALIPIGENDYVCLKNAAATDFANHSHWLIALEGQLKSIEKEYYCWTVSVYPADSNGSFLWNTPCYTSSKYDCIHMAFEHASDIEKCSKNDQLYSTNIQASVS